MGPKINFILLLGMGGFQEIFLKSLFFCVLHVGLISHEMLELGGSLEIIMSSPFEAKRGEQVFQMI